MDSDIPSPRANLHTSRLIGSRGHLIHKLVATDANGRRAFYFLMVGDAKEHMFLERIRNPQGDILNLEDYGTIVASCFGERPSEEVRRKLRQEYSLEV